MPVWCTCTVTLGFVTIAVKFQRKTLRNCLRVKDLAWISFQMKLSHKSSPTSIQCMKIYRVIHSSVEDGIVSFKIPDCFGGTFICTRIERLEKPCTMIMLVCFSTASSDTDSLSSVSKLRINRSFLALN